MNKSSNGFIIVLIGLLIMMIGASDIGSFLIHSVFSILNLTFKINANTLDSIIRATLALIGFMISLFGVVIVRKTKVDNSPQKKDIEFDVFTYFKNKEKPQTLLNRRFCGFLLKHILLIVIFKFYYNFEPLLLMTSLYQQKEFLAVRFPVPSPWLLQST